MKAFTEIKTMLLPLIASCVIGAYIGWYSGRHATIDQFKTALIDDGKAAYIFTDDYGTTQFVIVDTKMASVRDIFLKSEKKESK